MAKSSSPAPAALVPQSSLLSQMAAPTQPLETKPTLPFIGFQSKKSDRYADVRAAIPGLAEGQPYAFNGKTYVRVDSIGILDGALRYWAIFDNEMNFTDVKLVDPKDRRYKESILALTLAYSGGTCIPSVTTFRSTKCPVVNDLLKAVERYSDAAVCQAAGPIGAKLTELGPFLRVVGDVEVTTKTSSDGFAYQRARARCRLLNDTELSALATLSSGDQSVLTEVVEAFQGRKEVITGKVS